MTSTYSSGSLVWVWKPALQTPQRRHALRAGETSWSRHSPCLHVSLERSLLREHFLGQEASSR